MQFSGNLVQKRVNSVQKRVNSVQRQPNSTAFWLSVLKKWCLEKGIAKEIENYEPTQLNTLLERFNAEIKSKHG